MPALVITVKMLNDSRECIISVDSDQLVSDLKNLVANQFDVPSEHQKLIYNGHSLSDDQSLKTCELKDGAKLHLMVNKKRKAAEMTKGAVNSSSSTNGQECQDPQWLKFRDQLKRALRPHFTDPDAKRIISEIYEVFNDTATGLSLDDLERLAGVRLGQLNRNSS